MIIPLFPLLYKGNNLLVKLILWSTFFLPHIGEKYEQGFRGKKILVLGESHYGVEEQYILPNLTQEVVKEIQAYFRAEGEFQNYMRPQTRFVRAFFGGKREHSEIADFYDHITFYNYVQEVLDANRTLPTTEQFAAGEEPFFTVLEKAQPDIIIVWGQRLWHNMTTKNVEYDEANDDYYYVLKNGKKVLTVGIRHPSASNFSYAATCPIIEEALNKN